MSAMFDTLKFARALRDGGQFTPEQAERLSDALSDAISGEVVSRADLAAAVSVLERKIDDLRVELKQSEARVETKIESVKADIIKWVVGLFGVQVVALLGGLIAIARLLPR